MVVAGAIGKAQQAVISPRGVVLNRCRWSLRRPITTTTQATRTNDCILCTPCTRGHQRPRANCRYYSVSPTKNNNNNTQCNSTVPPTKRIISYLTDVEGDRDYLTRFVQHSKVLQFRPSPPRYPPPPSQQQQEEASSLPSFFFPYDHCIDFIHSVNNNNSKTCTQRTQYHMVYGGDVWDQGGSDLYVIRQLLDFSTRYPDHVHIIMGNRDVNKMRFIQELSYRNNNNSNSSTKAGGEELLSLPPFAGVYFLRRDDEMAANIGGKDDSGLGKEPVSNDPVQRLQWILQRTMGSPKAFVHRQWELLMQQQMNGCDSGKVVVDPLEVVESYQSSTHPVHGEMSLYLARAKLAVRLGSTLFLHGALPLTDRVLLGRHHNYTSAHNNDRHAVVSSSKFWDDLTFAMPWLPPSVTAADVGVDSVEDWFHALNRFSSQNVKAFREGQAYEGIWSEKGGYFQEHQPFGPLIQYGMGWTPDGRRNPSVVYNSWCHNGMPRKFFPDSDSAIDRAFSRLTENFFRRTGLELMCSGHQPQGDLPNPIRIPLADCNRTAWILSCDTSYSGDTSFVNLTGDQFQHHNPGRGDSRSGRGMKAVSEVVIEQCIQSGNITNAYYHGVLSDGSHYKTRELDFSPPAAIVSSSDATLAMGNLASGSKVPSRGDTPHKGRWWTRAEFDPLETEKRCGSFLVTTGEGFDIWNRIIE